MNLDISSVKKVFFIGIGGIGISALAQWACARGMEVTGVNDEKSPKTLDLLRNCGATVALLDDIKVLPVADLYVYSDAWVYRGPEIIATARGTGKPVLSYFEALGEFAKDYDVIAVSGTHGKTTTTAMIAEILMDAGLSPTVVVGSIIKKIGSNFASGKGKYLVLEADEYNRHFLFFQPKIGVITNIEADHLDYYKDIKDIQSAFNKFKDQSEHVVEDYEKYLDRVPKLKVPGQHNKMNAAAALAVADLLQIPLAVAQKSLAQFEGTWRRLELRGVSKDGVIIYDDYAHHPTEIKASLEALREVYPNNRIVVVFQPHLFSRTKALFNDFAKSFQGADQVLLLPIYFAREATDPSVSSEKLAQAIGQYGVSASSYTDFEGARRGVLELGLKEGDILVTMGAGEAYRVANLVFPALPT